MINPAVRRHYPSDLLAAPRTPSPVRGMASLLAIGGPVGLITWLALAQMANVNWLVHQVLQSVGS